MNDEDQERMFQRWADAERAFFDGERIDRILGMIGAMNQQEWERRKRIGRRDWSEIAVYAALILIAALMVTLTVAAGMAVTP